MQVYEPVRLVSSFTKHRNISIGNKYSPFLFSIVSFFFIVVNSSSYFIKICLYKWFIYICLHCWFYLLVCSSTEKKMLRFSGHILRQQSSLVAFNASRWETFFPLHILIKVQFSLYGSQILALILIEIYIIKMIHWIYTQCRHNSNFSGIALLVLWTFD